MAVVTAGGNGFTVTRTIRSSALRVGKISLKNNPVAVTQVSRQLSFAETPKSLSKKGVTLSIVKDLQTDSLASVSSVNKTTAYYAILSVVMNPASLNSLQKQISFAETPKSISKKGVTLSIVKDVQTDSFAINQPGDVKKSYTFWS